MTPKPRRPRAQPFERSPLSEAAPIASHPMMRPPTAASWGPGDGFLFSGNRHETVPRTLLLDSRLTPLERNAWQVFRLMLNHDGMTAFPTYETLRPYLASTPCGPVASFETVARALTMLRLTRWLTLAQRRRDPVTGRIQGNLYILHDEPLTPYETIQLDPHYLDLLSQSLTHASAAIRRVAVHALREVTDDPAITGRVLPHRLDVLALRMAEQGWSLSLNASCGEPTHSDTAAHGDASSSVDRAATNTRGSEVRHRASEEGHRDSEEGAAPPYSEDQNPTSESEASGQPAQWASLRIPKSASTVRTYLSKETTYSTARAPESTATELRLPDRFIALSAQQQHGALAMLHQLPIEIRQAVLDEWAARLQTSGAVRRPAGYLYGLIQRAIRGEFHVWAATVPTQTARAAPLQPPMAPRASNCAESTRRDASAVPSPVATEHIHRLRKLFHMT